MGSTANPPSAIHNVFVYGSLLADDVVQVLLNRIPASSPATLPNYHRFSIRGRVYPAILPIENNKVTGKVLLGITPLELHILDEFEDAEYERRTVDVFLMDSSEKLQAHTYVWENKTDPNLYGEWNFEIWKQLHKDDFLKMTKGFVEELGLPDSKRRVETYESFYPQTENNPSNP
ncbi:AIG2-like protein D [Olea europaea var. sylvestris]|uniref:AIG2-like protein D n=1 Tax=Olea europaea var. sylvestris TaxID=158386 RepID=UPI000C1D5839|nr:AIG2-like protein D [Olea europaea var. sylvestris]